jgi:hypothetical protein
MNGLEQNVRENLVYLEAEREKAFKKNDSVYLSYLYGKIDAYRDFLKKIDKKEN